VSPLRARIAEAIRETGPLTVAQYMTMALLDPEHGAYGARDPIGAGGDFTTAPEISQMFGEILGLWCVHEWTLMGQPAEITLIELGPGRGVLMLDMLRAIQSTAPSLARSVRLLMVEVSAVLQDRQREALSALPDWEDLSHRTAWARSAESLPALGPSIWIANEFLDCLPIRQVVATPQGWRERLVGLDSAGDLVFGLAPGPFGANEDIPAALRKVPEGSVIELCPRARFLATHLASRSREAPLRALFIDYGGLSSSGDSLQALRAHEKISPLADPGASDLTAHVDFEAFGNAARIMGAKVSALTTQGAFLTALGMHARAAALAKRNPENANAIGEALDRLVSPVRMGSLFKAICLSSATLPSPAGFPPA
jgi:NADH dehydrogenase [ubiquinone] 1 alpha subcomplex assembly factor 7